MPASGRLFLPDPSLATQFSIVASSVLLLGMLAQGIWLSSAIEEKAKSHAGAAATLVADHVIAPYVSNLRPGELLSPDQAEAIEGLMQRAAGRMQIVSMKLRATDGTILYGTDALAIGQTFEMSGAFRRALSGHVSVEFDELDHAESDGERRFGTPLVEVYVPIRGVNGETVAVAEFFQNAEALQAELIESRHRTWLMTGSIFLGIIASLLVIVMRGSRLIERQRHALTGTIPELSLLLDQNSQLQERVERASRLAAVESEHLMHRLGADLHDGPAQLISFALLRLDTIFANEPWQPGSAPRSTDLISVRGALTDAISEVRNICAGLSMPRIACQPIMDAIRTVVEEHARRTGTSVSVHVSSLPIETPHFVKASLCRFVQEGLNNSFRHASAKGRSVAAWSQGDEVVVEVTDEGPGMQHTVAAGGGLGLAGLSNRIESLGGRLQIRSVLGEGTRLTATMPVVWREGRFHQ